MSVYIRNRMAQPLELHFDSGTLVIAPYAEVAVLESAAVSPQVAALEKRGQLWVRRETAASSAGSGSRSAENTEATEQLLEDSLEQSSKRVAAARKVKTRKSN